jgi:two-component system, chemotaxis family, response regulator Rcp1
MTVMNILLVEDNPADVNLVREAMMESPSAAELHWVADGGQALDFLRRCGKFSHAPTPDLVLLDLNLPGIGGKEVLCEVKSDPLLGTIPVVVLTSSAAPQDVLDTYRAHGNAYMVKPANFDEYMHLIERIQMYWLDSVLLPTQTT